MKLNFSRDDFALDALSQPSEAALREQRYSEWHHFTFSDDDAGICGIVNFALSGDMRDPERGRCGLSLVTHETAHGWRGTMNVHGTEEARFASGAIDLGIASSGTLFRNQAYEVSAVLRDHSVQIEAVWTPRAETIRIENMGGFINTFIVPKLDVDGSIVIEGRRYALNRALGYHDHNWGAWDWSRDLGWNWGYLLEPRREGAADDIAIVFGQVTDASRSTARTELVLIVWHGARLTHIFLDEAVRLRVEGRYMGDIPRIPGVMALLNPGRIASVPERLVIDALDGADHLHIECDIHDAIQLLIPHPTGSAHSSVSELVGTYRVRGEIDGKPLSFTRGAFAELAGAGRAMPLPKISLGF
jgi:hypothetical protein